MSHVPIHAAIAAAQAAQRRMREEEAMVTYSPEDLNGWEFKIVRANTRKFRTPEQIEEVRREEAESGWELVEKFDDYRLRFKRRVERRSMDAHSQRDPYRTHVGTSPGIFVAAAVGIALLGALLLAFFASGGFVEITEPWSLVTVVLIVILIIGVVVVKRAGQGR